MRRYSPIAVLIVAMLLTGAPAGAQAITPKQLYERVSPSVVVVEYTYDGELGRREFITSGVVVSKDGLVVISSSVTPAQIPDEQMTAFKIIIPGDDQTELDAEYQGRDDRSGMTFVKSTKPHEWAPITFQDLPLEIGDQIYSVGLMPKDAGYKSYLQISRVAALLRGPVAQVLVTGGGVGMVGSPVFNAQGQAVGIVHVHRDTTPLLNDPRDAMRDVLDPPSLFVPARDFLLSLQDPPKAGEPIKVPHIGVSGLSGLTKDVIEYLGLKKDQPAIQVGDVIPGFPAAKAGLKVGEIIIGMNGQPLERGDEPDEAWMIMTRKIMRMKVGDKVTFSVLAKKGEPLRDVVVMLEERPMQANKAKRFYAEDLGFTTRDIVFEDTYVRKLSPETKGVMVALIKPDSSAQTGKLQTGDMISRLNQTPVTSLDQFKEQYEAFRKEHPREAVVMEVLRNVNTQVVRIEPPQ